jgi:LuxR family maltose regulon positive regulatory protein
MVGDNMARTTPQVMNDLLADHGGPEPIAVGSPAWFAWLERARLFAFRSNAGTFTARQETRARGGAYWRAYRTAGGRQRRVYLGRSADLTPARLWAVAAQLTADFSEQPHQQPEPSATGGTGATPPLAAGSSPILTTKLYVPRPRDAHVARPQLLARLAAGMRGPLTLIAAPAGFGKTTLLADLLATRTENPGLRTESTKLSPQSSFLSTRVAWLSLDTGDNDPAVFLRYLIAALQRASTSMVGTMALILMDSPQPPPLPVLLTTLINDLAATLQPVLLVLDDYHVIATPAIHEALIFMLDHLPSTLHLVIASREDPPLPLARLRGRGQLTELRGADLRFTPDEVAAFLRDMMKLDVSADEVAALATRTEGWIAGLQLAALAMQNHADRNSFVGAFTGSNRFVVDYLASEVLDQLPIELRTFMLHTSILNRMCGPLCDAVLDERRKTEDESSTSFVLRPSSFVLEELERANLFLIPLDEERRWYRYHQLFAEVLRERLARSLHGAQVADLHRRASIWFEQQELAGEAIQHGLAARDFERTADLIERIATAMALEGQDVTLGSWLAKLPEDLFGKRPYLALARASVANLTSDYAAVEANLQQAEASVAEWDTQQAVAVHREVAAHRAVVSSMRGDPRAIELGRMALAQLPERHPLRNVVVAGLSYAYFYAGNLTAANQILQEAQALQYIQHSRIVIGASLVALLAMVRRAQGRLREVVQLSTQVLDSTTHGDRTMPLSGAFLAYLLLGLTQCEQNDLDAAEHTLTQCAKLAGEYQVTTYEILAQFYLGQVRCARGDLAGALQFVEQAEAAGAYYLSPLNLREFEGYRAMLWLKQGNLPSATRWAEHYEHAGDSARPQFTAYDYDRFALAQTYMAQGQSDAAYTAVARLLHDAEATNHGRFVIWALVLQALILQAQGDTAAALGPLERALALAEPEGYVRVFVDEGARMAALLAQVAHGQAPVAQYAAKLLATFPRTEGQGLRTEWNTSGDSVLSPQSSALVEPLSARELEVLRLLAEGQDNAEIARTLVVAVSTIKSHINHIFSKLGVGNRLEAVLRARRLDLL